jgi:3-hexulose-6-phosphate synthase
MKFQISFDTVDLDQALLTAAAVAEYADVLEVGTLLIHKHGVKAVQAFKEQFPRHVIFADVKIVNHVKDTISLFANAGAHWISVMAGTDKNLIHTACTVAHNLNIKVMLDLLDSGSPAQSALEAKNLGADALLFNQPYEDRTSLTFLDSWEMVHGNTQLPIFISAKFNHENIDKILTVKPDGIIIGSVITAAENPVEEAKFFAQHIKGQ